MIFEEAYCVTGSGAMRYWCNCFKRKDDRISICCAEDVDSNSLSLRLKSFAEETRFISRHASVSSFALNPKSDLSACGLKEIPVVLNFPIRWIEVRVRVWP